MDLNIFLEIVKPFTMSSTERITELFKSLEYIRSNDIKGDFVECGVWKGGNVLGMAEYISHYNMTDRKIWLYDTFEGMTTPDDFDVDLNNVKASEILSEVSCISGLDEVKKNLSISSIPEKNLKYIVGDVCETLNFNENIPKNISILRLDTDWYKSTKKELDILYPLLSKNGVLIVDDYGHWMGARKAVEEYIQENRIESPIQKIDYTGIKIIKN